MNVFFSHPRSIPLYYQQDICRMTAAVFVYQQEGYLDKIQRADKTGVSKIGRFQLTLQLIILSYVGRYM